MAADELLHAIIAFIDVGTWSEAQRVVEQYPELLSPETDSAMQMFAMEQQDVEARRLVREHRALLARCREVGVWQAFAEKMQPTQALQGDIIVAPPGTEADVAEARQLEIQRQQAPRAIGSLIQVYKRILQQLRPNEHPAFRAAIHNNLGLAYFDLPMEDQETNLAWAIECFQEALRVYTPEATPFEYAQTQKNLALAYRDLPTGNEEANLIRAIECFQEALRVYTPEATPFEYAQTQSSRGIAYHILPGGDQGANLARAIACYQEALRFRTPKATPFEYARIKNNLGLAYHNLPVGDQGANLARAIECFQEALRVYSLEATPFEYAQAQNNLGLAYHNLPVGDQGANLARAIACYQEVLRVYTSEAMPFEYAQTQNNLGLALTDLPMGDRGANLMRAIACFQEALRFRTLEATPSEYAQTQSNLGLAYRNLPTGEEETNLARAIECYQEALRVYTPEATPFEYARTQGNLGLAYRSLPTGDRRANLARAIECYQEALRIYNPEVAPFEYARTQNNLGLAYRKFPTEDRGASLARAIGCYQEALRFRTPEATPAEYAETQNNLGLAYADLPTGGRGANLMRAIACFQEALRFWIPGVTPAEYARTQTNLGVAYVQLPTGDRGTNLARAIECYQEALRVYNPEATPFEYARTQSNLGLAYRNLPTGDRGANLMRAIACFQEALRFRISETTPAEYAWTQSNLGLAYTDLPTGDRGANLARAIECYQEALRFRTAEIATFDYAMIQNNLGNAYRDLPTGDRGANLARAIECYQEALRVYEANPFDYAMIQNNLGNAYCDLLTGDRETNLAQAIECYQEALRIYTPEAAPFDYAMIQNNLGNAYCDLLAGGREANLAQAIERYQEALRIYTPETAPFDCRWANRSLANLHFTQGAWMAALATYQAAIEAGEQLYRADLFAESKAVEVIENAALYRNAAFAAARLGHAEEALLISEHGKTRLLAEALRLRVPRPIGVPDMVWAAFEKAGAAIRAAQFEGAAMPGQEHDLLQAYETRMHAAHTASTALNAAIDQVREYDGDFLKEIDLLAIQTLLADERTALVAFCIIDQGSIGFVMRRNHDQAVRMVDIPSFTQADLNRLLFAEPDEQGHITSGWVGNYTRYLRERTLPALDSWRTTITRTLEELGNRLLAPILATLPPDVERLIFLPSSGLFLLPLHAAPLPGDGSELVCNRYQVSYAPSAKVLADSKAKAKQAGGQDLYVVINPEEDPWLPFASTEGVAISGLFDKHEVHTGRAGVKVAVVASSRGRNYVHFVCHGSYNWNDPSASGLALADGYLTLAELQGGAVDLSAARLLTLSACETGITDIMKSSADEYVGVPAGFLLAGVPCVVSSLWAVPDISTALVMERFYRNHLENMMDFAAALHEAQIWVRELQIGAVRDYVVQCYRQAEWRDKAQLLAYWRHYQHLAEQDSAIQPFAHPYYWAAFTVNGM